MLTTLGRILVSEHLPKLTLKCQMQFLRTLTTLSLRTFFQNTQYRTQKEHSVSEHLSNAISQNTHNTQSQDTCSENSVQNTQHSVSAEHLPNLTLKCHFLVASTDAMSDVAMKRRKFHFFCGKVAAYRGGRVQ
jgi:hypothetical protein